MDVYTEPAARGKPEQGQSPRFLKLLDPSARGFTFQTFDDDRARKNPALTRIVTSPPPARDELVKLNKQGAGVFVTINETDGSGRKSENITRIRAVWQEDDDGFDGALPFQPSMVVETSPGHFHRYWLAEDDWPADEHGRADFAAVMERMVESYGSDKNAKDIARVLRLPGFLHRKSKTPHLVHIIEASGRRYSRAEITAAFPPVERPKNDKEQRRERPLRDGDERRIADALRQINADDRDLWVQCGMAIKDHLGEAGRQLWDDWSRQSDKYSERDQDRTWKSFRRNGISIRTLFYHAQQAGWRDERIHHGPSNGAERDRADGIGNDADGGTKEPPRPLIRELPPADPFPIDALGDLLGSAATAIHERVRCPIAICGQSVIAAATLAAQAHADVQLPTNHVRPISNFFVTIAETGERKTAADSEALWPVRKREKALREAFDEALPSYENQKVAWEEARDHAVKKAKGDRGAIKFALDAIGPAPIPPLPSMLTCPEPTYEGLCKYLQSGQPSIGVFSTEGGLFIGGHGMSDENKLRTAAGLSELWDGEPIKRVRAGDGTLVLPGRRVSVHLMAQPDVAAIMLSDRMLLSQGLLSRCLITAPESTSGTRVWREPSDSADAAIKRYGARLLQLLERPLPIAEGKANELAPRVLRLAADARKLWIAFADSIERQIAPEGPLSPVRGLANKLPEHATRLAGVMALVSGADTSEIPAEQMAAGITLAQHYVAEALRLFEASRVSDDLRLAEKLLTWLRETWSEDFVSLPDIYQKGPNAIRDKRTAEKIIAILEDHGWLNREKSGAESGAVPPRRLAHHEVAMTAFKKFDPQAFLERERLTGVQTLATLATLAAPPPKNENRESRNPPRGGDSLPRIESRGDNLGRGRQLEKNQNLTATPAKVAKVAKDDNNFSNFSNPGPSKTEHDLSPYASALAELRAKCPAYVPEDRWHQAIVDAETFIAEWGAQAQALGWTVPELFCQSNQRPIITD